MKKLNRRIEPLELQQLHILRQRLPPNELLEEEYARLTKGFNGEVNVDFHLSYLDDCYEQLCQIRLAIDDYYVQLDSLLFSPTTIYIAEAKALGAKVKIDHRSHLMYSSGKTLKSPLLQVEEQAIRLRRFAERHQLELPIEPLVIFSENTTEIEQVGPPSSRLLYANGAARRIERMEEESGRRPYNFAKLIQLLKQHHKPSRIDMIEKYGVTREMIETGMNCEKCNRRNLKRGHGFWHCLNCGHRDYTAHLRALREFAIVFGERVTCKEARWWLKSINRITARRLLKELPMMGKGCSTYYDLSSLVRERRK